MNIENLKKAREKVGLTQAQAAEAIGVSDGTYKNYEQGKREPNGDKMVTIANLFGVSTDYLLGREPAPDPFGEYNLSEEDEKEMLEKYLSLPPEVRACIMDVMRQLAEGMSNHDHPQRDIYTAGELEDAAQEKEDVS